MRATILALVAAAGLAAVSATAQNKPAPSSSVPAPAGRQVTLCLDSAGERHSSLCQRGTELGDSYVCTCQGGLTAVTAPACVAGESPAEAGSAASLALKESLKTGTLNDVRVNGKRMCVQTRHAPTS